MTLDRPKKGELAIIYAKEGYLEVHFGDVNDKNDNLHLLEDVIEDPNSNEVKFVAKKVTHYAIGDTFSELQGTQILDDNELNYQEFLKELFKPEYHIKKFSKHAIWMRLFFIKPIKFNYLHIYDYYSRDTKCILATKYWQKKEYTSNNYVYIKH